MPINVRSIILMAIEKKGPYPFLGAAPAVTWPYYIMGEPIPASAPALIIVGRPIEE